MPNEIEFPDTEPRYDADRDCLSFPARVDGKLVDCLITAELLIARFGGTDMTESAMRQAYLEHKVEIRNIARSHLENGWIDEENRIFLNTRFTRLNITFSEWYRAWIVGHASAEAVQRRLTELIGPNAGEVLVELGGEEQPSAPPSITVRFTDPGLPFSQKVVLRPRDWQDPPMLTIMLAGAWGDVLRARSRKLDWFR